MKPYETLKPKPYRTLNPKPKPKENLSSRDPMAGKPDAHSPKA